ncbi:MAG: radical SAM protein [Myxococcota bacterium]
MDLHSYLLALVAPLQPGDGLLPGVVFTGAAIELGPQLRFTTDAGPVHVEVAPRASTPRHAAATEHLALSYRAGSSDAPVDPKLGQAVCLALAERITEPASPDFEAAPRVRHVEVTQLLERRALGAHSHYTLSPYVGCTIGCSFCYAQTRLGPARAMMGLPQVRWGGYVDARTNAAAVLADELASLPPGPIKFCPIVSDPYQPLERTLRLTRACLEALAHAPAGFTTMLLTRSALILEDLDRIAALPGAVVGVSLPTADADALAHFEPRGASLDQRLSILRAARQRGITTMAVVQPMLPGSVDALADRLAEHVDSVSLDRLRGTNDAQPLFDAPEYAGCDTPQWQASRLQALGDALAARGVAQWHGELPPHLQGGSTA